jgi:hypothetical protein
MRALANRPDARRRGAPLLRVRALDSVRRERLFPLPELHPPPQREKDSASGMKKRREEAAMPRAASPANSGHSSPRNSVAASPPEQEAAIAVQETPYAQIPTATCLDAILQESEILANRDLVWHDLCGSDRRGLKPGHASDSD